MRGDEVGLFGLVGVRHLLRVAARGFGLLELVVLDGDEFRPERLDLLLGRRAHVGRGDDRAQAPAGGDRLQARDADAHDEEPRRGDRAGGRHHHRKRPAIFGRAVDHCAIAAQIGLARQHVHDLSARDPRQKLHGEGCDPSFGHRLDFLTMAIRVHRRDDERAMFDQAKLRRAWPANLEHQIRAERFLGRDEPRARGLIVGVRKASLGASAMLDCDFGSEPDKFLGRLGGCCDAGFAGVRFRRNSNQHETSPANAKLHLTADRPFRSPLAEQSREPPPRPRQP